MKKRTASVLLVLMVAIILAGIGCISSTDLQFLQPPKNLKNHAHQDNGADVTAARSSYRYFYYDEFQENPQHPAETLINGERSLQNWVRGEGWECRYHCHQLSAYYYYYRRGESASIVEVIVDFPREAQLSRVIVYTVNCADYPAREYGISDLGLRYLAGDDVWVPVDLHGGRERYKGRIQNNSDGTIDFRFKPVMTRAIKLLVFDTNDSIKISSERYRRAMKGTVRIAEIEAYGTEEISGSSSDDLADLFGKPGEKIEFSYENGNLKPRIPLRLGVRGQEISPDVAQELGLASDHGILLLELVEGSLAAEKRAEIKIGEHRAAYQGLEYPVDSDILVDIDGLKIQSAEDIRRILGDREAGDTISLGIISSDGRRKNVSISPSDRGGQHYAGDESEQTGAVTSHAYVSKPAPSFDLRALDGEIVNLTDLRGKVVILDFWATWCPPCVKEIPHFIELYEEYKDQGFVVLGISVDRDIRVVRSFAQRHKVNYPILKVDERTRRVYGGVRSIPTTFVIDKAGKIQRQYVGYRNRSVFEADIRALLAEDSSGL